MADIQTAWNADTMGGDWLLDPGTRSLVWSDQAGATIVDDVGQPIDAFFGANGGIVSGGDLFTAVLISLFTDAAAGDDDVIPDATRDPRGWWGGAIGSKIWLRLRAKTTDTLLEVVRGDIATALQWLIDDGVVAAIDVTTEYTRPSLLGALVVLKRSDGARTSLKFSRVWETL